MRVETESSVTEPNDCRPSQTELATWMASRDALHAREQREASTYASTSGALERRMVRALPACPLAACRPPLALGHAAQAAFAAGQRELFDATAHDPRAVVWFHKRAELGGCLLGDVPLAPPEPPSAGQEPPTDLPPGLQAQGAGAVVLENDGRTFLMVPAGGFGGSLYTLPKGRCDGRPVHLAAAAEVFEEVGLTVRWHESLGVFCRGSTPASRPTWYGLAERTGGDPTFAHWETHGVVLAPYVDAMDLLTHATDRSVMRAALWAGRSVLRQTLHHVRTLARIADFLPNAAGEPPTLVVFDVDSDAASTDLQKAATLRQLRTLGAQVCAYTGRGQAHAEATAHTLARAGFTFERRPKNPLASALTHHRGILLLAGGEANRGDLVGKVAINCLGADSARARVVIVDAEPDVVQGALATLELQAVPAVGLVMHDAAA